MGSDSKLCYVIMPFSGTTDEHTTQYWTSWWKFLKKRIEDLPDVEVRRSEALRGDIVKEIIRDLYAADVVIADLTDMNPNVYWELGVRQSLKYGTITIAETREHVASDMGMKGVLKYHPKDSVKNEEFVSILKRAIVDCVENPNEPDSHVLETLSGRSTLYSIIRKEENIRKVESLYDEFDENLETIEKIFETYYQSHRKTTKIFIGHTVRCSCIEHLVTVRYLDESPEFYQEMTNYLLWMEALNLQLSLWGLPTDSAFNWLKENEDWFVEQIHTWKPLFEKLRTEYLNP